VSRRSLVAVALGLGLAATPAGARELWAVDGETKLELNTSLRASALLSRAPEAPELFPERDLAATFFRLRLEPRLRPSSAVTIGVAYEHRLWTESAPGLAAAAALPAMTPAPYRIRQVAATIAGSTSYRWQHELDRAFVALHAGRAEITVGRQAIGWGRGVIFGAVDLFAPFSPLEADREWRRGVDALRLDLGLGRRASLDLVAALGDDVDRSLLGARLRGYAGDVDLELLAGRRARDLFAGATGSAAVGDAEVHAELAVFRAPEPLPAGGLAGDRLALKAVVGASSNFTVGNGLYLLVELHHSGLGAARPEDVVPLLLQPAFRERVERGDTQILGRWAACLMASTEVSPELSLSLLWLQSPTDGSGVLSPSASAALGDRLQVALSAYLPWGAGPDGGLLRSDHGATPLGALVQLRAVD
jgi:hypothetical protein